jgi:type IV pilus assembly protein PilA
LVKRQQELRKNGKKGFTLVELIVVIVILGILLAIAVPSLVGYIQKARDEGAKATASVVYQGLQTVLSDGYKNSTEDGTHTYTYGSTSVPFKVDTDNLMKSGTIAAGDWTADLDNAGFKGAITDLTGLSMANMTLTDIKVAANGFSVTEFTVDTGQGSVKVTAADGKTTYVVN